MVLTFILINGGGLTKLNNMDILLTGASGFLGTVIQNELFKEKVISVGRVNSDVLWDLSTTTDQELPAIDLVIHAAGKAHSVPKTKEEKEQFFNVNVSGTKNLLDKLEKNLPKAFVFISSVSVYGKSTGICIDENTPLLATDAYGQSKIQTEELVINWCKQHTVICTIFRLPLIIGKNAPGNLGAMIKGIDKGYYLNIAGGKARKSMVLATDVAKTILKSSKIGGIYNLTDGVHPSFEMLSTAIAKNRKKNKPLNVPEWLIYPVAKLGDLLGEKAPLNSSKLKKITTDLTFDDNKARRFINWNPNPVLHNISF